ncbi:Zn-ribbon domain-containing OB-fold protein [Desulfotignum balticum]|uniref:Zn-ribbon domain-containing OB-fold protein n=1 Tax=Desulfotignum balticum TaxID=115781 RepID=UPI000426D114|nr:OB-fold domain-containing protein [Desulfotignum balticum]
MEEKSSGKDIYVGDGLFVPPQSPSQEPHLIGSKCNNCGEVTFPKQPWCANCGGDAEELLLSSRGKLYSFSNVNNPVPEGYKGPIPYGVGVVEVDGVRVMSYITEHDPGKLKIGMDMKLVIEPLFVDDEGNNVIGFKWRGLS